MPPAGLLQRFPEVLAEGRGLVERFESNERQARQREALTRATWKRVEGCLAA